MATRPVSTFGELLRTYRATAGLTQEELAERVGMSARGISDLERGVRRTPYRRTVELLAEALHLTQEEHDVFLQAARRGEKSVPPSTDAPANVRGSFPPLVGRRSELVLLQHLLDGLGSPVVLLTGESGIGKTRLLREAMTRARAVGWMVLEGSCSRRRGQLLYAPLLEALEGHMRAQPQESLRAELEGCAWLARLLPELAEQGLIPLPAIQVPPEQERRLLFAAAARYLTTIAGSSGTLLVLDDLQWAGADALDLLQTLLHSVPLLRVVGAYRNTEVTMHDPLAALIADLAREGVIEQAELAPLTTDEARVLLRNVLGERAESEEAVIERVLERAGGVPFFLISCARGLQAGALGAEEGAMLLPWDVQQAIRQRVAALPEAAKELLGVAAVIGRVIPGEVLIAAATRPEREILTAVEAACQARLLIEEGGAYRYQFAHDLICEVVEMDLSAARRRSLHRQVALAWEQVSAMPPPEVLAYHYAQAGNFTVALDHLSRAAERARAAGAHREEASLLLQAVACAEQTGQRELALELRVRRGDALRSATVWAEAQDELTGVLDQLSAAQESLRTEVLTILAEMQPWMPDPDIPRTRYVALETLRRADQLGRDDLAARAMTALALADSSDGQPQAALEHLRRALARAGDAHRAELASSVMQAGMFEYWLGQFQDAVESSRHALDLARHAYDTFSMAQALGILGLALAGQGRYAEAFEAFERARKVAEDRGTRPWLARALSCWGGVHLDLYDFAGAEALAQEAREVSRSVRWLQSETSAGIDLLLNFARRGEVGRAERLVDEVAQVVAVAQGAHGWLWRLRFATARGEIALARGAWEEAASLAEEVIAQSRRTGRLKYEARGLEIQAHALAAQDRTRDAIALLQRAVDLVRPTGDPAMFLRAATALLGLAGEDTLFAEAQARAQAIVQALPDENLIRCFQAVEAVRPLLASTLP
jgi:tetratricopeptide (TPR) repeat protein/transcriptional regulator with XRE-family HTH domain